MNINFLTIVNLSISFWLAGCAINPYEVGDPTTLMGHEPKVSDIVKSLRCEITTFITANRLRSKRAEELLTAVNINYPNLKLLKSESQKDAAKQRFYRNLEALHRENRPELSEIRAIPYIDIDSNQFAALQIDFKKIELGTLNIGVDWKHPTDTLGSLRQLHLGPSYSDTGTFQLVEPLAIPQNADLGPSDAIVRNASDKLPAASRHTTIYYPQAFQDVDREFFCYKSLETKHSSQTLHHAVHDVQQLLESRGELKHYENFTRINIGASDTTLGRWLQKIAAETAMNERTFAPVSSQASFGQLQYQFILNIKPSFNLKYTLVAIPIQINPLAPDLTASIEHAGTFTLWLNSPLAQYSIQAKTGNACLDKKGLIGPCATVKTAPSETYLKEIRDALVSNKKR